MSTLDTVGYRIGELGSVTRLVTLLGSRQEIHLQTVCVCPPIPVRSMDWIAVDDNTYDASFEGSDESGDHWKAGPEGVGATEYEAAMDLIEQLEEAA